MPKERKLLLKCNLYFQCRIPGEEDPEISFVKRAIEDQVVLFLREKGFTPVNIDNFARMKGLSLKVLTETEAIISLK